ncbi:unnamed protein product (macronuclear) [Paramecium tetraurelia]|uniref:MORN repeat protein n=1 Tax=Paramecium tetraurelia TaxID=5888 RepID=A0DV54_PARTE|nr:uncharacterized protein GSPATT00020584001 [Paramecium tetraurelia]CAK86921.1 unnamed protein product [Paramecium tetraurelia]|eukprot:XP_001454318.1 hypothetical protein (macronuclear) [Paramecium tetraurelia strain d4-2]
MGLCQGKNVYKVEKTITNENTTNENLCVLDENVINKSEIGISQLPNLQIISQAPSCVNYSCIQNEFKLPSGEGYLEWTYEDGTRYEGQWKDKAPNGKGKLWTAKGDIFEGQFVNGQLSQGSHFQVSGSSYTGEFMNGLYHGYGQLTEFNGNSYTGQFEKGMKQGKGILKRKDGTMYDGEWKQDIQSGFGLCVWEVDKRYEGQWEESLMHGQGTFCLKGRKYVGQYYQGQKHGKGTYYWNSNTYYDGEWQHGVQNGQGILVNNKQVTQTGVWKDGVFQDAQ